MLEPKSDPILDVLEGRSDASLEQLQAWRDEVADRVLQWAKYRASDRARDDLADAYRARLHEAVARGQKSAELILSRLYSLIGAAEAAL